MKRGLSILYFGVGVMLLAVLAIYGEAPSVKTAVRVFLTLSPFVIMWTSYQKGKHSFWLYSLLIVIFLYFITLFWL